MRIISSKSGSRRPSAPCLSVVLSTIVLVSAACSDEGPTGPGTSPPAADVASIEVDRDALSFGAVGSSLGVTATARDASGDRVPGADIVWSTRGTGVVEVVPDGAGNGAIVSALGNGSETLVATAGDATATVPIEVEQIAAAIDVRLPAPELTLVGQTTLLEVSAADSNGVPLASPAVAGSFTFSSADPAVAAVSEEGLVTANWQGTTTITVTAGTFEETASVTVVLEGEHGPPIVGETVACTGGVAAGFSCAGIDLVSYLPPPALGVPEGVVISDIWGWNDEAAGRRYALVGWERGVTFVDVTDPLQPRSVGLLPASVPSAIWRDLKVYADHVYVVADVAPAHGVQVFDLTRLRGVTAFTRFTEDARYSDVSAAHNIAINESTGFAYSVGNSFGGQTCGGGLHMIDLSNPTSPAFAGCFADPTTGLGLTGYTHDVQCVTYTGPDADYAGREICFGSNESAISIADVTDKANPVAVATATYPDAAYVHQGWLTEDQRYFIQNDEGDEIQAGGPARMLVWDVADLDDPVLALEHAGPTGATDHNLFVLGSRIFHSNYTFGIRVLDIADPLNPVELGYFDTFPSGDQPGFAGSWGNYPYFDDGRVIVTSMLEGLFILEPTS